jgi:hypothetical protein
MSSTAFRRALCFATLALGAALAGAEDLPDAPEVRVRGSAMVADSPSTYAGALAAWKSPEDIARFAGARFSYDRDRALTLAEPAGAGAVRPPIYPPEALYANPSGMCVDLARFGVETLHRIDPAFASQYLMLEFQPVQVEGRTLRRHWIATFMRDGQWWFFADSRRPGHVAGPYANVEAFIADYQNYRRQEIVAWRVADGYARRTRVQSTRR